VARIVGVDLPRDKRIDIALTYIFGIGLPSSQDILVRADISPNTRVRDLIEEEVNRLRQIIEGDYRIEGDLRRDLTMNIKRLMEIGCYRGFRHRKGLPVRGQRTHTNARTRKGKRGHTITKKKVAGR